MTSKASLVKALSESNLMSQEAKEKSDIRILSLVWSVKQGTSTKMDVQEAGSRLNYPF